MIDRCSGHHAADGDVDLPAMIDQRLEDGHDAEDAHDAGCGEQVGLTSGNTAS